MPLMLDDANRNMSIPRLPGQSSLTPGEQLYSNLYGKDMGLMRKMMNLEEFSYNGVQNKHFQNYTNGSFGAKFPAQNYGFRHEGLLKPCYDFPAKIEETGDNLFKNKCQMYPGFMNQFQHPQNSIDDSNYGFKGPNEVNNNGIVLKLENGVNDDILCSRSSLSSLSNDLRKSEPNEFNNISSSNLSKVNEDGPVMEDHKSEESNDGFTNL